jgi:hypothetical protein
MKYRVISGWVIATGHPRSICCRNDGSTLPLLTDIAAADGTEDGPPMCGIPAQRLHVKLPKLFGGTHNIGRLGGFSVEIRTNVSTPW